jgi:hypothetical protein
VRKEGTAKGSNECGRWTRNKKEQGGWLRRGASVLYSASGLGDRVRSWRCGDWLGSNLTAVSAYVVLSVGPDTKGGYG